MENVDMSPSTECPLLTKDPIQLRQLVDKVVEVTSADGKKIVGRVFTIDPVSNSVVLFKADGSVQVVIGHAVKHMELSSHEISIPRQNILSLEREDVDEEVSEVTKVKLRTWLLENRIPVEEEGNMLIVYNTLKIYPPYGCDRCVCTNTVMLEKVQRLISQMPK